MLAHDPRCDSSPRCSLAWSEDVCRNSCSACRVGGGWRQAEKPLFDVQHLAYKLKGNNVPMPSTLVRHLLRVFIPEIIQVGQHSWQCLSPGYQPPAAPQNNLFEACSKSLAPCLPAAPIASPVPKRVWRLHAGR